MSRSDNLSTPVVGLIVEVPTAKRWTNALLGIFLVALGALVYANTFPGDFFVDDVYLVSENPLVETMDIRAIFTTDYFGSRVNRSGLFRPLITLSYGVNRWLLGPEPWSYHLVNVGLHALIGLLFFHLLLKWKLGAARSFFAAALFAVHPIHTEVVNEMVGRSELFVALFFLLALRLFESAKPSCHVAAAGCYGLALLSKEHAVTFLAGLFFVDLFFRKGVKRRLPVYMGLLTLTAAWLLYRKYGLQYGPPDPFRNSLQLNMVYQPLGYMDTAVRVMTALKIQMLYLSKLVWPVGLQGIYSGPSVAAPVTTLLSFWGVGIVLACLLGVGLAVFGFCRQHLYGLAILLYVICFSVTANIFWAQVTMAERVAYLPSLWFCMGVAALPGLGIPQGGKRHVLALGTGLVLLLASGATWVRNQDYRNQESLWTADFSRDSQNIMAGIFLTDVYVQRQDYAKAEEVCRQILAVHPTLIENLETLAWVLVRTGRPEEAKKYAMQAVAEVDKGKEILSDKLMTVMVEINVMLRLPREVLEWLERIPPEGRHGFYWELKGKAYDELGDLSLAVEAYRQVGDPPPGSEVPARLERLLLQLGKTDEARQVQEWIKERAALQGAAPQ